VFRRRLRFVSSLLLALAAGCSVAPSPAATPTEAALTATTRPLSVTEWALSATPIPPPETLTRIAQLFSTDTPIPSDTLTPTPFRSATPILSATPIPSATPTFYFGPPLATRTPAPAAECPTPRADLVFAPQPDQLEQQIVGFLNQGGTATEIQRALGEIGKTDTPFQDSNGFMVSGEISATEDLTGDTVTEVLFTVSFNVTTIPYSESSTHILKCEKGAYREITPEEGFWISQLNSPFSTLEAIGDFNRNGVKELLVVTPLGDHGRNIDYATSIFEWDGQRVVSVLDDIGFWGNAQIVETSPDQPAEVMISHMPFDLCGDWVSRGSGAERTSFTTYAWGGTQYVPIRTEYSPPEFRFQAVQDGDDASRREEYDKALAFYQQAIFDEKLQWWSPEYWEYYLLVHGCPGGGFIPPTPPPPDPAERPRLAAYSRYRILLLHIVRGYLPEAKIVYDTLQEKFPEGSVGHPYAEMATEFWNEYNVSQNIGLACDKAIAYARAHADDVLTPLGSSYYGSLNRDYAPEDICPFK
jgi:hypothetical protein